MSNSIVKRSSSAGKWCLGWLALAVVIMALSTQAVWAQIPFGWSISEFQPNIPEGGRASTIAVNPANNNNILVASESGGLFRSADRGHTWHHVDGLLEFSTSAVVFVPANPNVVIATTSADFRTNNGGGIWRSTDGGNTWTQAANPPAPAGDTDDFSAWEISIAPDTGKIYVGNAYGVAISADSGATWTQVDVYGGGDHRVFSVVAQSGNLVLAGGPAGVRRSTDGGNIWSWPTAGAGGIWDMHALGRSSFSNSQAYVVNGATNLFYTEDSGDHWTQITSAPAGGGGCGGISFIKPIGRLVFQPYPLPPARRLDLYFGNRCGLSKMTALPVAGTDHFSYTGTWTAANLDHGDTRDLAFDNSRHPLLLATDGGLHQTANNGATWTLVGGGSAGYNALQITEVKGQWISTLGRHDLYFGTQDNNLWSSSDGGVTWTEGTCCEGFFIEGQHRVATATDSKIAFVACAACSNLLSGPLFSGIAGWPNPAGNVAGNPKIVRKSFHVQGVDASTSFSKGLAVTTNLGSSWQQYVSFPEDRRDLPKVSDPGFIPVLYQSIRTGWYAPGNFEINHLARIVKHFLSPGASVYYPAMNNFGGLGINPTMFAWYQVFAVDPGNTNHLIAPDVINQKMMETHDGAENWTEIPQLTSLVTDSGQFQFRRSIFPLASAVSFSPDDPNTVAVGTWQNGVMLSLDRGATWMKIPDSERVTYITSIEWRNSRDAIVSTYGRGLWRLRWQIILPWDKYKLLCKLPCLPIPWIDMGDPAEKYTYGVLVLDGQVQGIRASQKRLQEVFVSPGSSVAFISDSKEVPKIKITETRRKIGLASVAAAPAPPRDKPLVAGITLDGKGRVMAAVFSATPLSAFDEAERQKNKEEPRGREESPTRGKPYVQIMTGGRSEAGNTLAPRQEIKLGGRDFKPGTAVEIAIDGRTVSKTTIGSDGVFSASVPAPQELGLHSITVRDADNKVIDGVMFLVRNEDKKTPRRVAPPVKKIVTTTLVRKRQ